MDQNQKQKSLSQFIKSPFLSRAVTKLILSVSVFSLFFSHSTLLSFVHYFNFYFSALPFKLFSHTLDKNCAFLLCNGLLVFLAKYSGLFSLSSSSKYNLNDLENYEDDSQPKITIMETTDDHQVPLLKQEADLEETQTRQKQNAMQHENEKKQSDTVKTEAENSTEKNHEQPEEEEEEEEEAEEEEEEAEEEEEEERAFVEEDKAEAESSIFIEEVDDVEEEEEEEEEGNGNGKLSNEELNKKFDDFIRKMKEELRIEARQQLIMV